jgi:thiol:disulfide interchange protein DsbD
MTPVPHRDAPSGPVRRFIRSAIGLLVVAATSTVFAFAAVARADAPAAPVAASGEAKKGPVTVQLFADSATLKPGGRMMLAARFSVAEGWHLYYRDPGETGDAVRIKFAPVAGLEFGEPRYPIPHKKLEASGDLTQIYEGSATLLVPVRVAADFKSPADGPVKIEAKGSWLVCKESCIPGSAGVELSLPVASAGDAAKPANEALFKSAAAKLPAPAAASKRVSVTGDVAPVPVKPGDEFTVTLKIAVAEGWHVHSHEPSADFADVKTDLILDIPDALKTGEAKPGRNHRPAWPAGKTVEIKDLGKLSVYEGTVPVTIKLKASDSLKPDAKPVLRGILSYQACNDRQCEQPVAFAFALPIPTPAGTAVVADEDTSAAATPGASSPGSGTGTGTGTATAGAAPLPQPTDAKDKPPAVDADYNLGLFVVLLMASGLALNFMPCVLPVLGLKIISFVQQGGQEPGRVFKLGLVFSAGLLLVFLALGAVTVGVKVYGGQLIWGQQFGNPLFTLAITLIVFVFALSLFGVWTLHTPDFVNELGTKTAQGEGYGSAFVKGMLTTVLATPCTGPGMGALMGWAATQSPAIIMTAFASVGFGMALPYLILTANPGLMKLMPRPGAWMEKFERAMGFVLLGTVVWFLATLYGQYQKTDEENLVLNGLYTHFGGSALIGALGVLTCVGAGVWLIATLSDPNAKRPKPTLGWASGLGLSAAGFVFFFSYLTPVPGLRLWEGELPGRQVVSTSDVRAYTDEKRFVGVNVGGDAAAGGKPSGLVSAGDDADLGRKLAAAKNLRERVRLLVQSGKTVHVDFTADWCANCKTLKATVLDDAATQKLMKDLGVVSIVADWTKTNSEAGQVIGQWLSDHKISGIPQQFIYPAGKPDEPIIVSDYLPGVTYGQFHDALKRAGPSRNTPGTARAPVSPEPLVTAVAQFAEKGEAEFSPELVKALVLSGKTVHVEFTANWTASMKTFDAVVLKDEAVRDLMRRSGIISLKADWTETNSLLGQRIAQFLSDHGLSGIPQQFVFPAGKPDEPIIVSDYLPGVTYGQFHDALKRAGPSRGAPAGAP